MLSVHNITAAPDNHCFEHWHEVTCRNYSVTEYRRPVIGPFRGQITARRFGALTVSDVYSSFSDCGIEVTRGSGEIRRDPRDHFMLYLVCCGEVGVGQDGRTARIGAGDLFIYDQSQPVTLEFGGYSRGIVLTIPRPLMVSRLPTSHRLTARRIDGRSQLGALTTSIVRQIVDFDAALEEEVANRVSASALDILATTLEVEIAGALDDGATYGGRLDQVKRYVLANLDDAGMTIETIASAHSAAHAASPVLGRRYNTDPLALAATPDGELQSPRRRSRPPSDRRGAPLRLHRHLPFQPRIQKTVRLLTAHTRAPIVARWQPESTAWQSEAGDRGFQRVIVEPPSGTESEGQRLKDFTSVEAEFSAGRIAAMWGEAAF